MKVYFILLCVLYAGVLFRNLLPLMVGPSMVGGLLLVAEDLALGVCLAVCWTRTYGKTLPFGRGGARVLTAAVVVLLGLKLFLLTSAGVLTNPLTMFMQAVTYGLFLFPVVQVTKESEEGTQTPGP